MTYYDRRHAKMNQRSTKIVQLLSKEKDEITVSGFAEYFQVSQKTIRNDMKEINEILDKNKRGMIDIKSGGIVSIPADFKDSLSLLLEGNFYNYKLSKEERKKVASAIKTEDVNLLDNGFKFISVAKGLFAVAVSLFLFGMFAIIYNYIRMTGFRNFILLIRGIP